MIKLSETRNGTKEVLESFEHWFRHILNDNLQECIGA